MLDLCEIFVSIQGETIYAGLPCHFIRLSGCDLACAWCDTGYAKEPPHERLTVAEIRDRVRAAGIPLVSVTGGEPLCQEETPALVAALAGEGYTVLVETNGSHDISVLPPPAIRILDLKAPSSGMTERMDWKNVERLHAWDEVKILVADRADYEWARETLSRRGMAFEATILFGAVAGRLEPRQLAEWILEDRLPVRLQLQWHRLLWPDRDRGV